MGLSLIDNRSTGLQCLCLFNQQISCRGSHFVVQACYANYQKKWYNVLIAPDALLMREREHRYNAGLWISFWAIGGGFVCKMELSFMSIAEKILAILAQVTEVSQVQHDLDLPLYESGILDSMKTVEFIVALAEQAGIEVSPSEFEREAWATPRAIVTTLADKMAL
jgi:D-alanine--poly(phosphoribitol) ligase subunit 2